MLAVFLLVGMLPTSAQAITVSPELWAEIQAGLAIQNEKMERWHAEHPVETAAPVTTDTADSVATTPENGDETSIANPKPTVAKSYYADVPTDTWYSEAVMALTAGGLVKGYDDGLFHPNAPITTGEFATILCRIGGIETSNDTFEPHYRNGVYYEAPYNWAHMALRNVWNTMVYMVEPKNADRLVIRGEAITALNWVADRMPTYHENNDYHAPMLQISEKVWTEADIPDWDDVLRAGSELLRGGPRVYETSIVSAYNLDITQGVDDEGTCDPYATLTRAQLCKLLYNMGIRYNRSVSLGGAFVGGGI